MLKDDTVTTPNGNTLYRIRALVDIGDSAKPGDLGGYIESEKNLHSGGGAWVFDNARVSGDARVFGKDSIVWFSNVGSEYGTLTCYRGKDNTLLVTRGCFSGTDEQFLGAVEHEHGSSQLGREYRLLIEAARLRLGFAAPAAAQGD